MSRSCVTRTFASRFYLRVLSRALSQCISMVSMSVSVFQDIRLETPPPCPFSSAFPIFQSISVSVAVDNISYVGRSLPLLPREMMDGFAIVFVRGGSWRRLLQVQVSVFSVARSYCTRA